MGVKGGTHPNFRFIDTRNLHYVGSIKLCEVKELAEISPQDSRLTPCQTIGLEKTKCFRVTQEIYGKERTMIVTYNQPLFHTQYLTLHNDIAKAITELSILQQKLLDRAAGLIKGGKCPTVASITKQCQTILHRQYMKSLHSELLDLVPQQILDALVLAWHHEHLSYQSQAKQKRYHQHERQQWLDFAEGLLDNQFEPFKALVFEKLDAIVQASSLVEMVNAFIRPYLNSSKGQITQETLNLIMFFTTIHFFSAKW